MERVVPRAFGHAVLRALRSSGRMQYKELPNPYPLFMTGLALDSVYQGPTTVAAAGDAGALTIVGGEYQLNGGAWTSEAGTLVAGDKIRVRFTSSTITEAETTVTFTANGNSYSITGTTRTICYLLDGQGNYILDGAGEKIPVACADGEAGLPYDDDMLLLWNARDGVIMRRGGEWDYGYAGPQYDDDGVSVGAVPAIHHDADGNLRGVWGGPAYANAFDQATIPLIFTDQALISLTDEGDGVYKAAITSAGYSFARRRPQGLTIGSQHTFSMEAKAGSHDVICMRFITFATPDSEQNRSVSFNLTTGTVNTIASSEYRGRIEPCGDGWFRCSVTNTNLATSNPFVGFAIGTFENVPDNGAEEGDTIYVRNPQWVHSPYVFPYVPPETSVVSAAGTSSDNGLYLPRTDALTEAFAGEQNMIKNSKFEGAVVGSPGTAPTNWNNTTSAIGLRDGIAREIVGVGDGYVDWRVYGTATNNTYPNFNTPLAVHPAAVAEETWSASGTISIIAGSFTGFDATAFELREYTAAGVFVIASSVNLKTDINKYLSITRTLTGGTTANVGWYVKAHVNNGSTVDVTLRISEPSLVKNAAALPYVPTGIDETISTPATCTVACLVWPGATSAEVTADANILSTDNDVTKPMFFDASATIKSSDGTNTASVTVADGWGIDEPIGVALRTTTAGTKIQVGYIKEDETEITWGTAADFTGSFGAQIIRLAYTSALPIWNRHLQTWNKEGVAEADIIKYLRRA